MISLLTKSPSFPEVLQYLGPKFLIWPPYEMPQICRKLKEGDIYLYTHIPYIIHLYIYKYMYIYIYLCVHMCMYIYIYVCVSICTYEPITSVII